MMSGEMYSSIFIKGCLELHHNDPSKEMPSSELLSQKIINSILGPQGGIEVAYCETRNKQDSMKNYCPIPNDSPIPEILLNLVVGAVRTHPTVVGLSSYTDPRLGPTKRLTMCLGALSHDRGHLSFLSLVPEFAGGSYTIKGGSISLISKVSKRSSFKATVDMDMYIEPLDEASFSTLEKRGRPIYPYFFHNNNLPPTDSDTSGQSENEQSDDDDSEGQSLTDGAHQQKKNKRTRMSRNKKRFLKVNSLDKRSSSRKRKESGKGKESSTVSRMLEGIVEKIYLQRSKKQKPEMQCDGPSHIYDKDNREEEESREVNPSIGPYDK